MIINILLLFFFTAIIVITLIIAITTKQSNPFVYFADAIYKNDLSGVQNLIKKYPQIDCSNHLARTPLIWAVMNHNTEIITLLLQSHADINRQDKDGCTSLMLAVNQQDITTVELLIQYQANLDIRDNGGETALFKAAKTGNKKIVKLLLTAGANAEIGTHEPKRTVLNGLIAQGADFIDMISLLLDNGVNVNNKDGYGCTPLMIAVAYGVYETAHLLIQYGADVNCQDNTGTTPLIQSVITEKYDNRIALLLLKSGARKEIKNVHGETASDIAIKKRNEDFLLLLSKSM